MDDCVASSDPRSPAYTGAASGSAARCSTAYTDDAGACAGWFTREYSDGTGVRCGPMVS